MINNTYALTVQTPSMFFATGSTNIAPDGVALPCHSARVLPGLNCPSAKEYSIAEIWNESQAFSLFRGNQWLQEPAVVVTKRKRILEAAVAKPIC